MWSCENSGDNYDDDHDYESPRRRSSPAARCAPRFAPVLASPGFPERSGPFQSHPLQTATATAIAKRPRARSSRTDWDDPHRTSAFPRAARTLASLALAGPARTRAARTEYRAGPSGPWRAAGREPSSASPPVFQRRGRRCQPVGFAELRRSGHPTQSSSLLLGARPDPHPVVGVRIGSSPLRSRSAPRARSGIRVPLRRSRTCAPP